MILLENLSRIGFGTYRTSFKNQEHFEALHYAISHGCNLIDTSSNYMQGEAEKLVGKVLKSNKKLDAFVVTKTGYVTRADYKRVRKYLPSEVTNTQIYDIAGKFLYSIHVDYIKLQIEQSLKRFHGRPIDAFLIHNPEYLFKILDKKTVYGLLAESLSYLEEMAQKGNIRYYGISSNTLPFSTKQNDSFSIGKILQQAKKISTDHHFKLVQFPFNYYENEASDGIHENGQSLIDIARENGLVTIGNRPLNCNTPDGFVRLTEYHDLAITDKEKDNSLFMDISHELQLELNTISPDAAINDIEIISHLKNNWHKIGNPEAVSKLFESHLWPFINSLYNENPPLSLVSKIDLFEVICTNYSRQQIQHKAQKVKSAILQKVSSVETNIQTLATQYCLQRGIDHILVGMRNVRYVKQFENQFSQSKSFVQ